MSSNAAVEALLRVVAETAAARAPLAPILRERCGALGAGIADALERGEDLPHALQAHLGADLCALLAGPRPSLEDAALLAAERLRLERRMRQERVDALVHPIITLALVACALAAVVVQTHLRVPWPSLVVSALAIATAVALAIANARSDGRQTLPMARRLAFHLRMASRYERAALVAQWRLPEAQLERLLGGDVADLAPLLSHPEAADDARRLGEHHRAAAARCRRWNYLLIGGLIYVAGGALVVDAASGPIGVLMSIGELTTSGD